MVVMTTPRARFWLQIPQLENPIQLNILLFYQFKGAGGLDLGMGKIEFDVVFDREKCKLSDAFYGMKKYCS